MSPHNTSAAMIRQEFVCQMFGTPVMAVKIYNFLDVHTIPPFLDNHS